MSSARYLGAVDPHANDDFEEVYELLSKAKRRYRSVRATVVHTVDLNLAKEANRRFIDWRFDQSEPGMGIIGKPGPPQREDFYRAYEHDSKERVCLWHQMPHLWREERYDLEGRLKEAEGHGGERAAWPRHPMPQLWREERYDLEGRLKEAEVHGGKNGPRWTFERHSPEGKDHAVDMPRTPERPENETRRPSC